MHVAIMYPSGLRAEVEAEWIGVEAHGLREQPMLLLTKAQTVHGAVLREGLTLWGDPRALYCDVESGEVLYNPREHMEHLPRYMREWLAQHPEWPDEKVTKNAAP